MTEEFENSEVNISKEEKEFIQDDNTKDSNENSTKDEENEKETFSGQINNKYNNDINEAIKEENNDNKGKDIIEGNYKPISIDNNKTIKNYNKNEDFIESNDISNNKDSNELITDENFEKESLITQYKKTFNNDMEEEQKNLNKDNTAHSKDNNDKIKDNDKIIVENIINKKNLVDNNYKKENNENENNNKDNIMKREEINEKNIISNKINEELFGKKAIRKRFLNRFKNYNIMKEENKIKNKVQEKKESRQQGEEKNASNINIKYSPNKYISRENINNSIIISICNNSEKNNSNNNLKTSTATNNIMTYTSKYNAKTTRNKTSIINNNSIYNNNITNIKNISSNNSIFNTNNNTTNIKKTYNNNSIYNTNKNKTYIKNTYNYNSIYNTNINATNITNINNNNSIYNTNAANITNTNNNKEVSNIQNKPKKNQDKINYLMEMGKSLLLGGPKKECTICHKMIESHLHKIHVNKHPSQIFKWLYLGTFDNALDISDLRRLGINYILNCAYDCKNTQLPKNINELHLKIRDDSNFDIFEFFEQGIDFINQVRTKGGVVLVHCKFGISRSPSFVCAFLIKYFDFNLQSALKFIRKKRPIVNPNEGFMLYLEQYANTIKKKERKKMELPQKSK